MKSKVLEYTGADVTVRYDIARCIHAAVCVRRLPEVFDPQRKPWVEPDNASADDLTAVVACCPTGALHAVHKDGGAGATEPRESHVRVVPDGPLYVQARATLQTLDGEVLLEDTRMALCRCGQSQNEPLCDNAHLEAKFSDPGALGQAAGDGKDAPIEGELVIATAPNGPLLLDGGCEIRGADASAHRTRKAALCRCGLSANKPYCDGSHSTGGFKAD